jgi:hypothetical protein
MDECIRNHKARSEDEEEDLREHKMQLESSGITS